MTHSPPRLLKKVQMSLDFARDREPVERQGGGTHSPNGYPPRREAYLRVRRSVAGARGVPVRRMGLRRWAFFSSLRGFRPKLARYAARNSSQTLALVKPRVFLPGEWRAALGSVLLKSDRGPETEDRRTRSA
jgi:hypothetical protein